MKHRTVRGVTAPEVMPLDDTCEALAAAHTNDIDEDRLVEHVDLHLVTNRDLGRVSARCCILELPQRLERRQVVFLEQTTSRFRELASRELLDESELNRLVPVLLARFLRYDHAWTGLE